MWFLETVCTRRQRDGWVLEGKEIIMDLQPDFERFRKAVNHQEADRVPLCEALVGYGIMSKFLGHEVIPDDIASQVEFWSKAGYD
jgi:hypothetical protein